MKTGVAILVMSAVVPVLSQGFAADRGAPPEPLSVPGATSYVYKKLSVQTRPGGPTNLPLHVFDTATQSVESPRPAVICFFVNPGWSYASVWPVLPHAWHFASSGLIAVAAGTRSGRTSPFQVEPLQLIADVRSAIRWMRARARELGIDARRIAVLGISSGGHAALSAALLDNVDEAGEDAALSGKPDALVLYSPPVSTSFLTDRLWSLPEPLRERLSPIKHLRSGLPPSLVIHGKGSGSIPYSDLELFCSRSQALGNRCDLVGYDTRSDGVWDASADDGRWFKESLTDIDRFLTSLDYLPQR